MTTPPDGTDGKTLVERLQREMLFWRRQGAEYSTYTLNATSANHLDALLNEAADALAQTAAQLAECRAGRDADTEQFEKVERELAAQLTAALAERDAASRDAERYRWLRTNPNFMGWEPDFLADQVDTAIDAARQEAGEGKG